MTPWREQLLMWGIGIAMIVLFSGVYWWLVQPRLNDICSELDLECSEDDLNMCLDETGRLEEALGQVREELAKAEEKLALVGTTSQKKPVKQTKSRRRPAAAEPGGKGQRGQIGSNHEVDIQRALELADDYANGNTMQPEEHWARLSRLRFFYQIIGLDDDQNVRLEKSMMRLTRIRLDEATARASGAAAEGVLAELRTDISAQGLSKYEQGLYAPVLKNLRVLVDKHAAAGTEEGGTTSPLTTPIPPADELSGDEQDLEPGAADPGPGSGNEGDDPATDEDPEPEPEQEPALEAGADDPADDPDPDPPPPAPNPLSDDDGND